MPKMKTHKGAAKRFKQYFAGCDFATCAKVRDGDRRVVTLNEGSVAGHRVLIIDDLVRTGGTLAECAKLMHDEGASCVDVFVTHACFPNEEWRKLAPGGAWHMLFNTFTTTDTVPPPPGFEALADICAENPEPGCHVMIMFSGIALADMLFGLRTE